MHLCTSRRGWSGKRGGEWGGVNMECFSIGGGSKTRMDLGGFSSIMNSYGVALEWDGLV